MALFKSRQQREMERRLKVRRAKKRLSTQVSKLRKQREKYYAMGQEAARQERPEKMKLLAKAILQFRRMEKRFQDVLISLELFEAQKDMMSVQADFAQAMQACARTIRDANVSKMLANLDFEMEQANALVEEANERIDLFLESGEEVLLEDTPAEETEELAALEKDLLQGAQEQERGAAPDRVDEDIAAIQQELKKEV